ncbi:MAG: hypothetical protein ABSC04_05415 [Syntrophobacteraceae bacterium]|jgi:hypothetical protein
MKKILFALIFNSSNSVRNPQREVKGGDNMKKPIVLVIIMLGLLIFLPTEKVNANGNWVLWENASGNLVAEGSSVPVQLIVVPRSEWTILESFPTYEACIEKTKMSRNRHDVFHFDLTENIKQDPNKEVIGDWPTITVKWKNGMQTHFELKCFPESVDPRR